jgi:hypothetical protein
MYIKKFVTLQNYEYMFLLIESSSGILTSLEHRRSSKSLYFSEIFSEISHFINFKTSTLFSSTCATLVCENTLKNGICTIIIALIKIRQ